MANDKPQSPVSATAEAVTKTVTQTLIERRNQASMRVAIAAKAMTEAKDAHGENSVQYEQACIAHTFRIKELNGIQTDLDKWLA